ncbi:MAG: M48 family metallopeptidase [Bdellovibrionales bacterium]|nr:M48 family metallopeptidase [Bdellovibrionales bacterium]
MRIARSFLFFVLVIPFFAPSTSYSRLKGTNISAAFPQDLINSLSEYGYFEAGENDFGLTPLLTRLVQKLQQPGDPTYSVILSKTPDANAFIYQTVSTEAYVVVNIGLIQKVDTLDELVILLAHELSHSSAFGRSARLVRGQLEEIETADRGSMERTLKAGYDPRAILSLFSTLTSDDSTRSGFFQGFLGSHPNMESRRTAANVWLKENFSKRRFPGASPKPWPDSVMQYKARPTPKIKNEEPPKVIHELERLSKIANQSPAYHNLTPYLKMALFLGSLGSYEFDYYGLLQRAIDQNIQLDQSALSHIVSGNNSYERIVPSFDFDFPEKENSRFAVFLMNLSRELESVSISKEQGKLLNSLYEQFYANYFRYKLPLVDENGKPLSEFAFRLQLETAILFATYPESRLSFNDPKAIRDIVLGHDYHQFRFFKMSRLMSLIERSSDPRIIADSFIYADFSFGSDFIEENRGKLESAFRWAVEQDNYTGAELLKLMKSDKDNIDRRYFEILAEAFNGETISPARKIILYVQLERSLSDVKDRILTGLRKSFGSSAELFSPRITALNVHQGIEQVLAGNGASWKLDWGLATQIVQDTNAWQQSRSREIQIVDVIYKQYASRYSGPAYDYRQKYAELLQKWMASALVRSRELPETMVGNRESLQEWIRFWELITSRAVTPYTDQLALKIFSSENIKNYPDLKSKMQPALEEKRVWDFALRKELLLVTRRTIWNDIESTTDKYERTKKIQKEIRFINQVFPESSFERQVALEKFTNHIRANASEALLVENEKSNRDSNADGVGMRVFSGFYEHVFSESSANRSKDRHENTFATLQFLLGNAPIPKFLDSALEAVGPDRFQRMFNTLDPEIRALVLAPLLERPRGLLNDSQWEDKVIELILSGVTAHQTESRLFLRALIHSLEKEAPFEKTLVI